MASNVGVGVGAKRVFQSANSAGERGVDVAPRQKEHLRQPQNLNGKGNDL